MKPKFGILFILIIFSCQPYGEEEFVLENDTSYPIEIKAYQRVDYSFEGEPVRKEKLFAETIKIPANSFYSSTKYIHDGRDRGIFNRTQVDSISIVFGGKRIIEQFCNDPYHIMACEIERNLMDIYNNYEMVEISKDETRYTYYFTNEDFERARPTIKN